MRGGGTPKSGKTARSLSKKRAAAYKHLMETNVEVEQKPLEIVAPEEESFETLALRARAMRGDKAKIYQESKEAMKKKETRSMKPTELDGRKVTFDSEGNPLVKVAVKIDKLPK